MPIYEFQCGICQAEFEELVRSQAQAVVCPNCGSDKTVKQMSTFAMKTSSGFSGSGSGSSCSGCSSSSCTSCGR